jgi:putative membrane protein
VSVRASEFLGEAERRALEQAVAEQERRTGGEIVVAVVRACDEYGSAGWRLGVALAAAAFLATGLFAPPLPWTAYLAVQAAALALGHALARLDGIRRLLVSDGLIERRVSERARRCFAEQGLVRTRSRTGILIFAALFEHRVVVLADEGIDRALGPGESWQTVVDAAREGLRAGRAADGLAEAVRLCGDLLARHLPALAEDRDELPNAVVVLEE